MWPYNELLFDSFTQPWEPDLPHLIEAVFVQKRGTEGSKEHARLVHRKLLERLGANAAQTTPLVEYDPSAEEAAFRLLRYECADDDACVWL